MTLTVRAAARGDFDAIAAITNHYIEHTAIHFGYEPVTAGELADAWDRSRERYPFLVARRGGDGAVVAYAKATAWRERAAYRFTCETGIYVADGARGGGIGRTLYVALLDEVARVGFHTVVAGIALPNEASVKLHESLGFAPIGAFREVGWKHERWHDVGFWQRAAGATT